MIEKIGNICKVRRGASPRPIGDSRYFGGNVGWVRISDVTSSKKYLRKTDQYLSLLGEKLSVRVNKGDLIMSICATLGKPIIIDMPACIHDGFVLFYDLKDIDTEYLYYAIQNIEPKINGSGQSGTQKNLNTSIVEDFELYFPKDKREQTKIATILASIDKSIEQTESLIAKYTRIKTGLMQDLLTKGIDKKGNIRDKKTHQFIIKNGIEVPIEWEVSPTIKELYMKGRIGWQGLKASEFQEEGNYLVTGIHFSDDNKVDWNKCFRINDERYELAPEIQLKIDDVLITKDGTIGKIAIIDMLPGKATLNSHLLVLRPLKSNILPKFLFYLLLEERFKYFIDNIKTGSTLAGLTQTNFGLYNLCIPDTKEQVQIISTLELSDCTLANERQKLFKLQSLKAGLMQDLLSGKVKIKI